MTTNLEVRQAEIPNATPIQWPERYQPARADVFAHNEIVIPAPIATVWRILLRAAEWPEWYPSAHDIHFVSHTGPDLRDRSRFRWNTFGLRITSKVLEFERERLIAWNAHGIGVDAYHVWLLTSLPDGSTHVVTEETQRGWVAALGKRFMPEHLPRRHRVWLEHLSRRAQRVQP
jgi:uncharacterized protein YndB with AHSA1/START domain